MTQIRKWMKGSFLAGVLAVACALSASATCLGVGTVTGDALRLRDGAGIGHNVLASAAKGTKVVVLSETDGWYQVDMGTQKGYMSTGFVSVAESEDADLGLGKVTTAGDPLNLRGGAGTSFSILTKIPNGKTVSVAGVSNGWYKVTYNGYTGYVNSDYLTLVLDANGTRKDGAVQSAAPAATASTMAQRIVAEARKHVGKRYVSGGKGPNSFDCSGLVYYVVKQASGGSIRMSGGSSTQWRTAPGQRIYSINQLQAGDIYYICDPAYSAGYPTSHAAIYIGNGQIIHAADHKKGVVLANLRDKDYRYFVGAIRLS